MHIMLRYYDYYRYANAITLDAALVDVLHVQAALLLLLMMMM